MVHRFSSLDYVLFDYINQNANKYVLLDHVMVGLSKYSPLAFVLILGFFLFLGSKNKKIVFQALLAAGLTVVISKSIQFFFYRDRPFISYDVNQLLEYTANSSFPSDHTACALVIAVTIWFYRKQFGFLCIIAASGVAVSRIWIGVHFPFDVLAGIMLGGIIAFFVHYYVMQTRLIQSILHRLVH
ncbi:phosphatase PAP2 family protein [Bacillus cereus]|uniref:phosphatase PAP2 family protein n=1 Tax=Bacillus cereus TaxID=1396 RepID=UPI001FFD979C|nr:phosphatase PAP2 family protein [Bacillus cereus]UPJ18280.1 phosphatase PAP2 family protein [Bacillus cereus]